MTLALYNLKDIYLVTVLDAFFFNAVNCEIWESATIMIVRVKISKSGERFYEIGLCTSAQSTWHHR